MLKLNKLKALGFAAMLNAAVLTGCTTQRTVYYGDGPATIYTYNSEGDIDISGEGKISFDDMKDHVRIIEYTDGENNYFELVLIGDCYNGDTFSEPYYTTAIELSSGVETFTSVDEKIKVGYTEGGYTIVDMQPLLPYLIEEDNLKGYYEVQELVDVFDEIVEEKGLNTNNKTLK